MIKVPIAVVGVGMVASVLSQVASTEPSPVPSFDNMGQVWIALIVFATAIYHGVSSSRREERQRQWAIEDRKAADEKAEKEAEKIRTELIREANTIKTEAWRRTDLLSSAVAENTRLTNKGIEAANAANIAANHVNDKILAIGGVRVSLSDQALGQVPVKVIPLPERRPGDNTPKIGRRNDDPPPVPPVRRDEDKKKEPEK